MFKWVSPETVRMIHEKLERAAVRRQRKRYPATFCPTKEELRASCISRLICQNRGIIHGSIPKVLLTVKLHIRNAQ